MRDGEAEQTVLDCLTGGEVDDCFVGSTSRIDIDITAGRTNILGDVVIGWPARAEGHWNRVGGLNDVKAWLLQHGAGGEANPIVAGSRGDDPFWKYTVGPAGRSKKRHLDRRIGGSPLRRGLLLGGEVDPF